MKRFSYALIALLLVGAMGIPPSFADIQMSSNGSNLGIVTKINVVGATCARSGQTATITTTSGTGGYTATTGNIVATLGNIVATAGNLVATAGNISATAGNIVAAAGNISATLGSLSAGSTVTAGTGITSTTGNIVASAGSVTGTSLSAGAGDVSFRSSLTAIGQRGGTSAMVSGSTAIPVSVSLVQKYIGTTQAGTLANGLKGQVLKIIVTTNDAAYVYTVTPTTKTGYSTFALDTVGDFVTLLYVDDTIGWIIIGQNGAVLA